MDCLKLRESFLAEKSCLTSQDVAARLQSLQNIGSFPVSQEPLFRTKHVELHDTIDDD